MVCHFNYLLCHLDCAVLGFCPDAVLFLPCKLLRGELQSLPVGLVCHGEQAKRYGRHSRGVPGVAYSRPTVIEATEVKWGVGYYSGSRYQRICKTERGWKTLL